MGQINDGHRSLVGIYLHGESLLQAQDRRHVGKIDVTVDLLPRIDQVPGLNDLGRGPDTVGRTRPRVFGTVYGLVFIKVFYHGHGAGGGLDRQTAGGGRRVVGPPKLGGLKIVPLNQAFQKWKRVCNHVQTHQSLGYLTPLQYLGGLNTSTTSLTLSANSHAPRKSRPEL